MKSVLVFTIFLLLFPSSVLAEEVHIYLFYGNTCPICEEEREYLKLLQSKYETVQLFEFETFSNSKNEEIMNSVKDMYRVKGKGVPFTVVGDVGIYGFSKTQLESAIKKYSKEDYYDRVGVYLGLFEDEEIVKSSSIEKITSEKDYVKENKNKKNISFPIIFISSIITIAFLILILKK